MTNASFAKTALKNKSHWMKALRLTTAVLIGFVAQGALAQTTTINFDNLPDATVVTNQYQSQGVMVSGATVANANIYLILPHSGPNVAFAPNGLMVYNLSIANVKSASAYITGPANVGLFAYDSSNNLVGQAISTADISNGLLSVTSSGNPIARLEIHDGGSSFYVDDVSFVVPAPAVTCTSLDKNLYDGIAAVPLASYSIYSAKNTQLASAARAALLASVTAFEKYRASNPGKAKLQAAMQLIQTAIKAAIKAPASTPLVNISNDIITMIKAGGC